MTAVESMGRTAHRLWSIAKSGAPAEREASEALFRAIRWRLALWYGTVLAVALLLSGLALYAGVRHSLLSPVDRTLQRTAQVLGESWEGAAVRFPGMPPACGLEHFAPPDSLYVCYDIHGRTLGQSRFAIDPDYVAPSLVSAALRHGHAEDTVHTRGLLGSVARYAVRVPETVAGGRALGVMQVGVPIGAQLQALDTLLHMLMILSLLTLLVAVFGGLFLANRALLPARLANARQRDFIADASHELRMPLTMLRSNIEVVLRGKRRLPKDDVALLEDTVMEATHLTSLANNMLDLARLDQDGVHLEEDVVDLERMASDATRWATSLAEAHNLRIHSEPGEAVLVVGDHLLLQQAVLILMDNAIKYNQPGGEVVVRTWADDRQAHLEVRDTGIGIEAVHLSRLGERFYRVDKARSRESGGAGLGLSIVRRIASRHHGSFVLASVPGEGTRATLTLPAARSRTIAS